MSFGAQWPTVGISATAASKSVAIPVGSQSLRIVNTSATVAVFVQFGIGSATAVIPTADSATGTACIPVAPFATVIVDVPQGANYMAVIGAAAGPSLVYLTPGNGE